MTSTAPRICCLDLDTFFVSVERLFDPSLVGKPVVVGGRPGQRGVVTACSYEVRKFGVRSGMSLTSAYKLAPQAVYLPTRHDTYGGYASRVVDIARRYSPVVQVASIDEMFIDFHGCEGMYREASDADGDATILRTVRELTATIQRELGLPASCGIGTSKKVAKVTSGLAKPAGVVMVKAGEEAATLAPLPVRKLPGVGPVAEEKLHALGVRTLGQLARMPVEPLAEVFGAWAQQVQRGARGEGEHDLGRERPAFREHDPTGGTVGSISNERTFREDVGDPRVLEAQLCSLCERVCWRARKRGVQARTVSLKLRYSDFKTLSRSRTVPPTASELELYPVLHDLYLQARTRETPVRLLGVALSNLGVFEQLPMFAPDERLHGTVDEIRERYGFDAIRIATGSPRPTR